MKEAFKLGGYAWHAHKRFEQLNKGWSFHKTVEWLKTIGIRFHETSMMRFANVYSTYANNPALNASLTESYRLVNEQAEQLTQMPEGKIEILGNIFKALPSDDTTNPKELIRELIRAGKNLAKVEHFGNKGVRKTYGYGKRTSKLKLARMAEKEACENGLYATFSGCNVSLCYIREKTQHRANKREWLLASIDDYMESRRLDEGERFKANRKR